MSDITFRLAEASDVLTLSMLATQVFLDTYATEGIRPSVAREVQAPLGPAAIESLLAQPDTRVLVAGERHENRVFAKTLHPAANP